MTSHRISVSHSTAPAFSEFSPIYMQWFTLLSELVNSHFATFKTNRITELVQQASLRAPKPDYLSSVNESHLLKDRANCKSSTDLLCSHTCLGIHTHMDLHMWTHTPHVKYCLHEQSLKNTVAHIVKFISYGICNTLF